MKKTTLLFLLGLSVCFSSQAQRRNMLGNSNFETISEGNFTDWSLGGNGIFPTDATFGDIIINGSSSLAVYGTGDVSYSMVSANCPRLFTTNFGDQFKFKFKANLIGVASAKINVVFQMNWGADVGYLFNDEVTLTEGSHEYVITSKKAGEVGTINVSDRTLFSLQFGMVPTTAKLYLDDAELTNITENWSGNIKTNNSFEHPTDLFEFWSFGSYSVGLDTSLEAGNKNAKVTVNGASGYDCVTGRCFVWAEMSKKNYQFEITANASAEIDSSFIQANNDGGFPSFITSKFKLKPEKQTFVMDWPASALPGAATYYLDMRFAATAPTGTDIWIYNWKVNEIIPLTAISVVMPASVSSGTTVPVSILASPTDANNAVELSVTSGNGTVSQVNGEWFFTSNGGTSTINAVSKLNAALTSSKVVESLTAVVNPAAENIIVYPTQVKNTLYIKGIESNATIEIYNNLGQLVRDAKNVIAISVSGLTKGMYIVKVKSGSNTIGRRIQVI